MTIPYVTANIASRVGKQKDKYQKWITKSMRLQTFLPKRDSIGLDTSMSKILLLIVKAIRL